MGAKDGGEVAGGSKCRQLFSVMQKVKPTADVRALHALHIPCN